LFAILVATFGGVDRGFAVEVVAGAHVSQADPIGVKWDSSSAIWKTMGAHEVRTVNFSIINILSRYLKCN
jgi:hypothetical protein